MKRESRRHVVPQRLLLALMVPATAVAFDVESLEDPWANFLHTEQPENANNVTLVDEIWVHAGEQVHLGFWLNNPLPSGGAPPGTDGSVSVTFDLEDLVQSPTQEISAATREVRVLTYRERQTFYDLNDVNNDSGDGHVDVATWADQDGNGFISRGDFDILTPHQIYQATANITDPPAGSWHYELRSIDAQGVYPDGNEWDVEAALFREADPLPLFATDQETATLVIPPNESRIVWITLDVPGNVAPGTYYGDLFSMTVDDGISSTITDIPMDVHVRCWDTFHVADYESRFYDYSYRLGRGWHEGFEGIFNHDPATDPIPPGGVDVTSPVPAQADARAIVRETAGINTLYWNIAPKSHSSLTSAVLADFQDFVTKLADDLDRYKTPPYSPFESPRGIETIVLGMTTTTYRMFGDDWGTDPAKPDEVWELMYERLFTILEDELVDNQVPVDEFRWIVNPIDEPAPYCEGPCNTNYTNIIDPKPIVVRVDDVGGTDVDFFVEQPTYFGAAARAIRAYTPQHDMNLEIMLNHNTHVDPSVLQSEFENCGLPGNPPNGCVDIWMRANVMSLTTANDYEHPLRGLETEDEFWLYDFLDLPTRPGRHAASGLLMAASALNQSNQPPNDFGHSGSGDWALWAINNSRAHPCDPDEPDEIFSCDYLGVPEGYYDCDSTIPGDCDGFEFPVDVNIPNTVHTWTFSPHDPWEQWNSVYFTGDFDGSRPAWIPELERVSPGRTYFARRQAMELHRLMLALDTVPSFELSTNAKEDLSDLAVQALDSCHRGLLVVNATCPNSTATFVDVKLVAEHWLDDVWGTCGTTIPQTTYTGDSPDAAAAFGINPWVYTGGI